MGKTGKANKPSIGNIISAIIFTLILAGLVFYALVYEPDAQYNSSFFDDVARSVQWK